MDRHIIRTSETDSVKGIASKQKIDIGLWQTSKTLPHPNVSTTLSQRSVYEQERQAGNKFRLIVTIVPYCSNVLFNSLTEIIKNEGSEDSIEVVTDKNNGSATDSIGVTEPDRIQMICNTEYSSEQHGGYEYHPGYDFFDNHLLRNQSFKIINPINTKVITNAREVFNTLLDYTRDRNGDVQIFRKRRFINDSDNLDNVRNYKHLYLKDDILSIDESINQNLYEENGWWGFANNTTIDPKKIEPKSHKWTNLDIGKSLNNAKACEFINMYPDKTLYSFTPKFNKFTHKNEYNWNVVLTYPYKNIYNHPICLGGSSYIKRTRNSEGETIEKTISEGNRWMGLKVMSVEISNGAVNNNIIFRTYTKHGLKQGELFYVYYTNPYTFKESGSDELIEYADCEKFGEDSLNGNEQYYETERYYKVTNVGNLSKKNKECYFYTSNVSFLIEIYQSFLIYAGSISDTKNCIRELYDNDDKKGIYDSNDKLKTTLLNTLLRYSNFRIRRCVNGVKSTYYIRQFRKIPNFCAAQRKMTDEEKLHSSKFNGIFDTYVAENAYDPVSPKYQRTFKNETYQLAFASSIYNDNATQITFTDGINTEGLTDNLGRPLSEIYYTIIKNNAGNEIWYDSKKPIYSNKVLKETYEGKEQEFKDTYGVDYDGYKIEFSHCFGKVCSGLDMLVGEDDTESNAAPIDYWKKLSSVKHISKIINTCTGAHPVKEDTISNPLDTDINAKDTYFYGDLVEFNPIDFKEQQISKVMHRFNTAQRETINNEFYSQYQYHEITSDDYDKNDFTVTEYSAVGGIVDTDRKQMDFATISRPEGYYYQSHYPIQIREYTQTQQGSHYTLRVSSAKPVQKNGILIQIKTAVSHGLDVNDVIFICDDDSDIRYISKCVQVINRTTFLMSPDYSEYIVNATDFEDREHVSNLNKMVYTSMTMANKNKTTYKKRFSWLELCNILNGEYEDDLTFPRLTLRRKNVEIPDYATYIGGNQYLWRNLVNIGDINSTELDNFVFANGYFYLTNRINFYLKRQDPFGTNGLYFDGDNLYPCFPNDPSGDKQNENYYLTKDTEVSC